MIPIDNRKLYEASLAVLRDAVGHGYLGRIVQIFLACKHYGKAVPQIGDASGISSRELESLLDDLYIKPARTKPEKILILFDNDYKIPSYEKAGSLAVASNIWRNNLNLQKGFMCYGAEDELLTSTFRNQSRTLCPHLVPSVTGQLKGAACNLKEGTRYRGEDHPKVFRKSPDHGEYFVYDPSDTEFYRGIVLPNGGGKLPVVPLIIALYYEGKLGGGRNEISVEDFLVDFDFSDKEYSTYFEDDPESVAHKILRSKHPKLSWLRHEGGAESPALADEEELPGTSTLPEPKSATQKGKKTGQVPTTAGANMSPPAGSFWWSAEQAVRLVLEADGWTVLDTTRLGVGFDLKATKGKTLRLVEVKSSIGPCAPTLTEREYKAAVVSRADYVLAIVEHFDPKNAVNIQWVRDPARLQLTARQVRQYFLPRSVWSPATGAFPP